MKWSIVCGWLCKWSVTIIDPACVCVWVCVYVCMCVCVCINFSDIYVCMYMSFACLLLLFVHQPSSCWPNPYTIIHTGKFQPKGTVSIITLYLTICKWPNDKIKGAVGSYIVMGPLDKRDALEQSVVIQRYGLPLWQARVAIEYVLTPIAEAASPTTNNAIVGNGFWNGDENGERGRRKTYEAHR